eukprot:NODE_11442_length_1286_cov_4.204487.p1 GENE.NODE_11442_length_1286_cov_4.204487~~NODE_11442_length_1286_cov_4.204487.p1  ORF type:complete len:324 (-),score=71.99 NODE_11442_length_1286_cov_4.204487:77-1048(-)
MEKAKPKATTERFSLRTDRTEANEERLQEAVKAAKDAEAKANCLEVENQGLRQQIEELFAARYEMETQFDAAQTEFMALKASRDEREAELVKKIEQLTAALSSMMQPQPQRQVQPPAPPPQIMQPQPPPPPPAPVMASPVVATPVNTRDNASPNVGVFPVTAAPVAVAGPAPAPAASVSRHQRAPMSPAGASLVLPGHGSPSPGGQGSPDGPLAQNQMGGPGSPGSRNGPPVPGLAPRSMAMGGSMTGVPPPPGGLMSPGGPPRGFRPPGAPGAVPPPPGAPGGPPMPPGAALGQAPPGAPPGAPRPVFGPPPGSSMRPPTRP